MRFYIAVFRSRNETLYLANMLNSMGLHASIVNTPKDAGLTCGISVRFSERIFQIVKECLMSKPFRTFDGFYLINQNGNRNSYQKIM